jgi:hypothetical protein
LAIRTWIRLRRVRDLIAPQAELDPLCQLRPRSEVVAGASSFQMSVMTSDDSLSLILRRLDEIERKLDRMLEELQTPTAIGYSARRGNHPGKD